MVVGRLLFTRHDGLWMLQESSMTLTKRVEWFLGAVLADGLGTFDIQIHYNRLLPASHDHGLTWHIRAGIDFLVRDVGRNVDEISGVGLIAELQPIAPAHTRTTSDNVNHRLQLAMMVGASFGVWLNDDGTGPQLACPGTRLSNGGGPRHSWSLGRVRVQLSRVHDLYAMFFPVQWFIPRRSGMNGVSQYGVSDASVRGEKRGVVNQLVFGQQTTDERYGDFSAADKLIGLSP